MKTVIALIAVFSLVNCTTANDASDPADIAERDIVHPPEEISGASEDLAADNLEGSMGEDVTDIAELFPCEMTPLLPWYGEKLCTMDTGEMEMWGLCPFQHVSHVPAEERLFFGGNPERRWGLPKGAQCPVGFECFPAINPAFADICDFKPTAFGALPILVYEPVEVNGEYLMAGADQGKNADPSAILALNPRMFYPLPDFPPMATYWEPTIEGFKFLPVCPAEHLTVPLEQAQQKWHGMYDVYLDIWQAHKPILNTEPQYPPCTSKRPWGNPPPPREMLTQWGPFVQYVIFANFKGVKGCNIAVKTYACGSVLMFTEQDFEAVMNEDEVELCKDIPAYHATVAITRTIVSESMKEAGLENLSALYDWCKVDGDSCKDAAVCQYCYGAPCATQEVNWLGAMNHCLGFENVSGPMDPFCEGNHEIGESVPRPGHFSLFPVPGYVMEWHAKENAYYFEMVTCQCDPSGEGNLKRCNIRTDDPNPQLRKYIPPSEQFARIPEFLEGCTERLLSPPTSL